MTLPDEPVVEYVIEHHFTFSGIALKDLPQHLLDIAGYGEVAPTPTVVDGPASSFTLLAPAGTVSV